MCPHCPDGWICSECLTERVQNALAEASFADTWENAIGLALDGKVTRAETMHADAQIRELERIYNLPS